MLNFNLRRLATGAFVLFTLFAIPGVAQARTKPKPKRVAVSGTVTKVNAKRNSVSVKVAVRGKRHRISYKTYQARIASTAKLLGRDRTGDGLLGTADVKRGDRIKLKGSLLGLNLAVTDLTNSSSLPRGDNNADGLPDSVETNDVLATLVSVNAEQHLLTLQVTASPDQADLVGQQITVSMVDGALLSLGDRNRDGSRNWNDIQTGDQFALMLMSPVDAANAQATLAVDLTSMGRKGKDRSHSRPRNVPMGGEVTAVDPAGGTITVQPSIAGVALPEFTLHVSDSTQFEVDDQNDDSTKDLNDIQVGDRLKALVALPMDPANLQAVKIISKAPEHSGRHAARLSGQVIAIDSAGGTADLAVDEGPLAGQTVTVNFSAATNIEVDDQNGDGSQNWDDVQSGDQLAVVIDNPTDLNVIMAWDHGPAEQGDNGGDQGDDNGGDNGGGGTFTPPAVLIGTISAFDLSAGTLTMDVVGGPLDGQSVTVKLSWRTALGTTDNNADGRHNWRDVQVGDHIGVIVNNTTDLEAWIMADAGSGSIPDGFGQAGNGGSGEDGSDQEDEQGVTGDPAIDQYIERRSR